MSSQDYSYFDRIIEHSSKNKNALIGVFVVALLAAGGFYARKMQQEKVEEKAQAAYFVAEKEYSVADEAANPSPKTEDAKAKEAPIKEARKTFDTTDIEKKLTAVTKDFGDSTASFQASLLLAQIHADQKQIPKAIEDLEPKAKESAPSNLIDAILLLKLSSLYEQNKQCDKAISILDKLANQSSAPEFKPEALLRQGLCNETLGNADKAKAIYQKLSTEFSDTQQGQQATKYLKLLVG